MAKLTRDNPLFVKAFEATLETDDYGSFATQILFNPTNTQVTQTYVDGSVDSKQIAGGWNVQIGYVQDWESAKSLSRFFYKNAGETVPLKFKPESGTGLPAFTSNVDIGDGPIGGTAGQFGNVQVTFACTRPVLDSDDDPITPEV